MGDKKDSDTSRGVPLRETVNPNLVKKSVNPPTHGEASANPVQSQPVTPPAPKTPKKKP